MDDATYTVEELQVLFDLAAERLFDLQADFGMLQDAMVNTRPPRRPACRGAAGRRTDRHLG
jgi:hypothetical protein